MSDYTTMVMEQLRARFERTGISLQEFGEKMGYQSKTARKSAWQFLNETADPRLSMVEKACVALGVSVSKLLQEPAAPPPSSPEVKEAIAAVYDAAASEVLNKRLTHYKVISTLSAGTDAALASLPQDGRKAWDQWRRNTGQDLHIAGMSNAEFAAKLLNVASSLRKSKK